MTAIPSDLRLDTPRRRARWRGVAAAIGSGWGLARPVLLLALPIVLAVVTVALVVMALRAEAENRTIAELKAGGDIAVSPRGVPEVLLARIEYLLDHDRVDEVQPFVEGLDKSGSKAMRVAAHYDLANGRLRQGFEEISASHLDKAGPYVELARQEYRRTLALEPLQWDAKFNLDVASRLVRDFPAFERTMGDTVKQQKKLWTDVPGKPEGLP